MDDTLTQPKFFENNNSVIAFLNYISQTKTFLVLVFLFAFNLDYNTYNFRRRIFRNICVDISIQVIDNHIDNNYCLTK